jgi:glycerol dehydrogenase
MPKGDHPMNDLPDRSAVPYFPFSFFGSEDRGPARVFVSPHRYVQGPGVLHHLDRYLSVLDVHHVGLLISASGRERFGADVKACLDKANISLVTSTFGGECSLVQIESSVLDFQSVETPVDCVLAVGGGKCVDAGKAIAFRLGVEAVVVPTLASTDAPCSALSVIYSESGAQTGVEFFPSNPGLVVIDTEIIAKAPARYFVAGMADALATWYEAQVCISNPIARSTLGARPTLTAASIGKLCADTIYEHGREALDALKRGEVTLDFENVVEANTLHSGIGFESGGLAGAHALASALTIIPKVDEAAMHGEMVALGILTQLVLQKEDEEFARALAFFMDVGLPVHLGHVKLDVEADQETVDAIVGFACGYGTMANFEFDVDEPMFKGALFEMDRRGRQACSEQGDAAFHALR